MDVTAEVACVRVGFVNVFAVSNERTCILIDAGTPGSERRILNGLATKGIDPRDIQLIVITHAHFDHAGALASLQKATGARVLAHKLEAEALQAGKSALPRGTSFLADMVMGAARRLPGGSRFNPCPPDIAVEDRYSLEPFGLAAAVVHTPGHTKGSLSVVFFDGTAAVGDLVFNFLPLGLGPVTPPFVDDLGVVHESWQKLVDMGVCRVLPAHGHPVGIEELARRLGQAGEGGNRDGNT